MACNVLNQRLPLQLQRFGVLLPLPATGGWDSGFGAAVVVALGFEAGADAAEGFGGDASVPGSKGDSGSTGTGFLVSVLDGASLSLETGVGGGGGKSGIDIEPPGAASSGKFSFGNSSFPIGGNVTLAGV